jgi:hypothetical protein
MILVRSVRATEEAETQSKKPVVSTGWVIDKNKTKFTKMNRSITNLEQDIIMSREVFQEVQNFGY